MKTLLQLFESEFTKAQLIDWLEEHAPIQFHYFKMHGHAPLMRGVKGENIKSEIQIHPGSSAYRPARNTGDFYKVMLDACNPEYPRRGYSVICTTGMDTASSYGAIINLFPPDNTKVGVVGKDDLHTTGIVGRTNYALIRWVGDFQRYAFRTTGPEGQTIDGRSIAPFVQMMDDIEKLGKAYSTPLTPEIINTKLKQLWDVVETIMKSDFWTDEMREKLKHQMYSVDGVNIIVYKYFNSALSLESYPGDFVSFASNAPEFNYAEYDIELMTAGEIAKSELRGGKIYDSECWFEGTFAAIPRNYPIDVPVDPD